PSNYITNLGLGYSIAIALGFLVLLPTILLTSYIYCRHRRRSPVRSAPPSSVRSAPPSSDDIILPRVIFVVEDDDDDARDGENSASAVGLDPAVINSYPRFSKDVAAAAAFGGNGSGVDAMCSICLSEYKDLEMMRMMPECRHFFHMWCLDD
ncbi:RING-H2 finger protein ATL68, partial [Linum perenne]